MKRVQYDRHGGTERMYVGEWTSPPLGRDEVRVRVKAAALNPLDWKLRQGAMRLLIGGRFPKGMGTDFAGVVEAVGANVTEFAAGDEVLGTTDFRKSGAFAEAIIVDAKYITRKPARLSFADAACLPIPAMTAWVALLEKGQIRAGTRVFVHGCSGAVGAFAVQLAIAKGAHVSGACGFASADGAKAAGVDPVFGYSDKTIYARNGKFDLVFDTLGTLDVGDGLSMLRPNGVFVDINPGAGRMLRGMLTRRYKLAFAATGIKHLPAIARLAASGTLRSTIGLVAPFGDALGAIANAENGPRPLGRTVLAF